MPPRVEFRLAEGGTEILAGMGVNQTQWCGRLRWNSNQSVGAAEEGDPEGVGVELGVSIARDGVHQPNGSVLRQAGQPATIVREAEVFGRGG